MTSRLVVFIWIVALPICGWQDEEKPSPFETKSQRSKPAPSSSKKRGAETAADFPKESGRACFFSAKANGGMTASGVRLDSEELMAAHASYPLGSSVKVTNVANGKTVVVKVVDRYPPSANRIINLSEAAARQLEFVQAGTAEVNLEPVR